MTFEELFAKCKTLKDLYYCGEGLKRRKRIDISAADYQDAYKNRFNELRRGNTSDKG